MPTKIAKRRAIARKVTYGAHVAAVMLAGHRSHVFDGTTTRTPQMEVTEALKFFRYYCSEHGLDFQTCDTAAIQDWRAEIGNPIKRTRCVCETCGSENVTSDALCDWNPDLATWEVGSVLDNSDCNRCGGECSVEHVSCEYDPWAHARPLHRVVVCEEKPGRFTGYHFAPGIVRGDADLIDDAPTAEQANALAEATLAQRDPTRDGFAVLAGDDYP